MFGNQVDSGPDDDLDEEESELNLSDDENEESEEESEEENDRGDTVEGDGTGEEESEEDESEEAEESESEEESDEEEEIDPEILAEIAEEGTTTVPIARLNKVIEENKRLKGKSGQEQEEEQEPVEQVPVFDLKAKLREKNAKLLEGDEEAALALDLEIEAHREQVATARAVGAIAQAQAARTNTKVIADVQAKFPQLADGDEFDQDALDEVKALRDVYMRKGDSFKVALQKAAEKVCGTATVKPDKKETEKKEPVDESKKNRLLARAKLAGRQPPAPTGKVGSGNRTSSTISTAGLDLANMSDADYDALPEAQKRQMRGD